MSRAMRRVWRGWAWAAAAGMALLAPQSSSAQVRVEDLVVTTGFSGQRYTGNLASITAPVVDSTDGASAVVGEVGVRGALSLFEGERTRAFGTFDTGLRQYVASGFQRRDYSPQEFVARAQIGLLRSLGGWGDGELRLSGRTRTVDDRPPMPLFLQASFDEWNAAAVWRSPTFSEDVRMDVRVDAEQADFEGIAGLDQLRLLDRRSNGAEVGISLGSESRVRAFTALRWTDYPEQESFDPTDPFRRDRTLNLGASWSFGSAYLAEVGVVGTINRSNSSRPEYDAISLTADLLMPLPWYGLNLNVFGVLTGKSYVQDTDFARLVPGEEADDASIVFVDLSRAIADNLGVTLRFGWTRAETDIGDSYYQRIGTTLLFNYRPLLR